jgi:acyl-CoA synthetase (NDP forming)
LKKLKEIKKIIDRGLSSQSGSLTEKDAKILLGHFGIPVVREIEASGAEEALGAAGKIGFPLVIKGMGAGLLHKTEMGLVHLNIKSEDEIRKSIDAMRKSAGDDLEGFLVQPYLQGKREFVAGLFRDEQFGPVVMFGLGGVFTEAVSDVTFRVAPITETDAAEMLEEIGAKKLLGEFRGEAGADRKALVRTLLGLSEIGTTYPEISEIDINPLLVTPEGKVTAVDALAVLSEKEEEKSHPHPVDPAHIGDLFYPKSIAFIGASGQIGKWGHTLVINTISGGYKGDIYLVNPKGGEIAGRPVYKSLLDIPGDVDLGIVTIPASGVMDVIPQFKEKGVKNMVLITSGFSETGEKGKDLEKQLVKSAREAGILVLGPNTMGITNPHILLHSVGAPVTPCPGGTAMVSQSGNMGVQLLAFAEQQGIGIRGFCGSGNEAVITIEDFLDGFEVDELTETVILYVESVKNGRRFFESAKRVGKKKPIILLKGGQSEAGNKAASSHTGAMTSDSKIFDVACRQTGVVAVKQSMDLLDLAAAFSSLPLPRGKRVGIMTLGGGWGVITADLSAYYGLEVPELSPEIITSLDKILPDYWSRANPIDIVGEHDPKIPLAVMEALLQWEGCDGVINLGIHGRRIFINRQMENARNADPTYPVDALNSINELIENFEKEYREFIVRLMEKYGKPVYGVNLLTDEKDQTVYQVEGSSYKGLFYESPGRAVKAFAKMYEYYRFISK